MGEPISNSINDTSVSWDEARKADPSATLMDRSLDIVGDAAAGIAQTASSLYHFPEDVAKYLTGTDEYMGQRRSWSMFGGSLDWSERTDANPIVRVFDTALFMTLGGADLLTGHALHKIFNGWIGEKLGFNVRYFTPGPTDVKGFFADLSMGVLIIAAPVINNAILKLSGVPVEKGVPPVPAEYNTGKMISADGVPKDSPRYRTVVEGVLEERLARPVKKGRTDVTVLENALKNAKGFEDRGFLKIVASDPKGTISALIDRLGGRRSSKSQYEPLDVLRECMDGKIRDGWDIGTREHAQYALDKIYYHSGTKFFTAEIVERLIREHPETPVLRQLVRSELFKQHSGLGELLFDHASTEQSGFTYRALARDLLTSHPDLANRTIMSRMYGIGEQLWQPGQNRYNVNWQTNWATNLYETIKLIQYQRGLTYGIFGWVPIE